MIKSKALHLISPSHVLRGDGVWEEGKHLIAKFSSKPLILGRSKQTLKIRATLLKDLQSINLKPNETNLSYDCCFRDIESVINYAKKNKNDSILAAGGGKVLDAGKLVAHKLSLPCTTVPLSAATCAGWTALSNIYSETGAFIKDESLKKCPELLIFDHSFVREAPPRTLASGIADALAKWYEASLTSGSTEDGLVQQSVQMARVLRDQLLIHGQKAFTNPNSDSWVIVAEGCALTAGMIGGIGGAKCRTAAAHAIHNGLTQLNFSKKSLHGELVGFGIITQLSLEEKYANNKLAKQSKKQLIKFLEELKLPTAINALGIETLNTEAIKKACEFACRKESEIHNIPFHIDEEKLLDSLLTSENKISIRRNFSIEQIKL